MALRFNKRRRDENKSVELIALPVIFRHQVYRANVRGRRLMLSLANNSII